MTHPQSAAGTPPAHGSRLALIEIARGCAASVVVLYHCARHLNASGGVPFLMSVFQFGHAGVDLFFVISGFIISHVHFNDLGQPARLGHYLRRRFERVYPLYWIATAAALVMITVRHPLPGAMTLLVSATLYPFSGDPLLGGAWTLQHEVAFYLTFGLCIFNRRLGLVVAALWLVIVLAGLAGMKLSVMSDVLISPFNIEFLFGVLCAIFLHRAPSRVPRGLLPLGLVIFALAAIAEDIGMMNGYADFARLTYGISSAAIVLGAAQHSRGMRGRRRPILSALGSASYSIYLFQFIFISVMWQVWQHVGVLRNLPLWVAFPFLGIPTILGGVLVSRCCEFPLLRLMRNRTTSV